MSNLIDLVPPLELCKLIPVGEFADSALCWIDIGHTCVLSLDVIPPEQHPFVELRRYTINGDEISAPTLQEILEKLPAGVEVSQDSEYFCSLDMSNEEYGESAVIAAMKVWLKWKGAEE